MKYLIASVLSLAATSALAEPPVVEAVEIRGTRVSVTLSHPDTGWDHYADGWRIETGDGTVIGTRELLHPHVEEQPFTRSLNLMGLPDGPLFIRAKCSVDGWSDQVFSVER
ncbi:hypothetical protein [Marivita hallyeonensis]|uniref:Uncharacterized protein n=1 Tax=Marivita hallyeonensis TaxID=996342 RepID=A0A1M5TXD0_9RHOB|nr:hypothetical protein [Marivita hallyeonensis]SHH55447.1 hypothetical protein SAMN05443551_2403 [Marivita hallyeonensis]